ncbi:MAG: RNase H family protein [Candidatus Acidiferrales bacterium]
MREKNGIRIFTDGSGQRPDGKSSGFAWIREDTRQQYIERVDGLTNNVAEYRAVISALKPLRPASNVEVLTDSLLLVSQLRGEYRILDPKLIKLANEVSTIVARKGLKLKVTWVPRQENLAGKLI